MQDKDISRIERLLVALLMQGMKGASQREKALQLNLVGFSNVEIADFLQTNTQNVAQTLYESRKAQSRKHGR